MPARRILLVDGQPETLKTFSGILDAAGYEVTTAASGEEAVRRLSGYRPDLVLLDAMPPARKDARIVREFCRRDIPVVVIAGIDDSEELPGISRVIYAPCRPRTFLEGLEDAIRRRRGPRLDP